MIDFLCIQRILQVYQKKGFSCLHYRDALLKCELCFLCRCGLTFSLDSDASGRTPSDSITDGSQFHSFSVPSLSTLWRVKHGDCSLALKVHYITITA